MEKEAIATGDKVGDDYKKKLFDLPEYLHNLSKNITAKDEEECIESN